MPTDTESGAWDYLFDDLFWKDSANWDYNTGSGWDYDNTWDIWVGDNSNDFWTDYSTQWDNFGHGSGTHVDFDLDRMTSQDLDNLYALDTLGYSDYDMAKAFGDIASGWDLSTGEFIGDAWDSTAYWDDFWEQNSFEGANNFALSDVTRLLSGLAGRGGLGDLTAEGVLGLLGTGTAAGTTGNSFLDKIIDSFVNRDTQDPWLGEGTTGMLGLAAMLASIFGDKDPESQTKVFNYPQWMIDAMKGGIGDLDNLPLQRGEYTGDDQVPWPFPYVDEYDTMLTDMYGVTLGPKMIEDANIAGYMSPYLDAVLTPQLEDLADQASMAEHDLNRRGAMMNAFGSERDMLYKDRLWETAQEQRQGLIGKTYDDAYNFASKLAEEDTGRRLDTLAALPGLYNALGDDRFAWSKFNAEFPYEIFKDFWNYGPTAAGAISGAYRNLFPSNIGYTQVNTPEEANEWAQLFSNLAVASHADNSWMGDLFGGFNWDAWGSNDSGGSGSNDDDYEPWWP